MSDLDLYFAIGGRLPDLQTDMDKKQAFENKADLDELVTTCMDFIEAGERVGIYTDSQGDVRNFLRKYGLAAVDSADKVRQAVASQNAKATNREFI